MQRILFLFALIHCSATFGQLTGTKIGELKNVEEVSIGNTGDFADGKPYEIFINMDIEMKKISGNYTNFGGGDFSINYIIRCNNGIFEITIKESGIQLNGKNKIKLKKLKILNVKQNKITTNNGVFIFSKAQKGANFDPAPINGFLVIENGQRWKGVSFIWKQ
jgi:hypothetical protein